MLGLPRGGVPVAAEVAAALHAPLDAFLVRKLGVPGREELAMGAVATGGVRVLNDEVVRVLRVPPHVLDRATADALSELRRQQRALRGDRPPPDVAGRLLIVVDDGLATGSTVRAAIAALRQQGPASIAVAVPTAPEATLEVLRGEADDVVCPLVPRPFIAVGQSYEDFSPTSDEEVRRLVGAA